jgi:hypothetical protein
MWPWSPHRTFTFVIIVQKPAHLNPRWLSAIEVGMQRARDSGPLLGHFVVEERGGLVDQQLCECMRAHDTLADDRLCKHGAVVGSHMKMCARGMPTHPQMQLNISGDGKWIDKP